MNKLKGTRCYLSGAIEATSDFGVGWRQEIGELLKQLGVTVLDPRNKPTHIIEEKPDYWAQLKKEEKYDELVKDIKLVRCVDLRMVDVSDFLIVNIDIDTYTCGTWEEVFLANRQKKPIILRVKQGKAKCPGWMFGVIPHQMIFGSWTEVEKYLIEVDCGEAKHYKRWFFFDYNWEEQWLLSN